MLPALLLLLLPLSAGAVELQLWPADVPTGGVALLRLHGLPAKGVRVDCLDRELALQPAADGGWALLGIDLAQAPGTYPVTVRAPGGRSWRLSLRVVAVTRPAERLTLPPAMAHPRAPAVIKRITRERQQLLALFDAAGGTFGGTGFRLPVTDPLGSPFGLRRILNGEPRSPHSGVDFHSPAGTPVRAPAAGRVVLVADLYYTGRTVVLDHGAGLVSLFAHLQSAAVSSGAWVKGGALLGRVGATGRATGPHLHWSVRLHGQRVDPLELVRWLAEKP